MSMNLEFTNNSVTFPFQTPTSLTLAVLAAPTNVKKLELIDEAMKSWKWTKAERNKVLTTIRTALANGNNLKMI